MSQYLGMKMPELGYAVVNVNLQVDEVMELDRQQ
jgi:hypothetical protein